jgi:hypothetical protein
MGTRTAKNRDKQALWVSSGGWCNCGTRLGILSEDPSSRLPPDALLRLVSQL